MPRGDTPFYKPPPQRTTNCRVLDPRGNYYRGKAAGGTTVCTTAPRVVLQRASNSPWVDIIAHKRVFFSRKKGRNTRPAPECVFSVGPKERFFPCGVEINWVQRGPRVKRVSFPRRVNLFPGNVCNALPMGLSTRHILVARGFPPVP